MKPVAYRAVWFGAVAVVTLVPAPAFAAFSEFPLTDSSQTFIALNFGAHANVNFRYAPAQPDAAGPVNFVPFDNVDPRAGPQMLSSGVTIAVTGAGAGDDRSRFQNTAATIGGVDDANLESVVNTIGFVGFNETSTITVSGMFPANDPVQVRLIGGDAGTGLGNWFGDFTITANGLPVGVWNAADDDATTATIAEFDAAGDASGSLVLTLTNTAPPLPGTNGSFAGFAAVQVLRVPEPSSAVWALGVGGFALFARRRRR